MLKLTSYPAQCFLAYPKIRCDTTQRNSFEYIGALLQQIFVAFVCRFKLGIYKPFFQLDIIFFIRNPYKSFNFVVFIQQGRKAFLGNDP